MNEWMNKWMNEWVLVYGTVARYSALCYEVTWRCNSKESVKRLIFTLNKLFIWALISLAIKAFVNP